MIIELTREGNSDPKKKLKVQIEFSQEVSRDEALKTLEVLNKVINDVTIHGPSVTMPIWRNENV